MATHFGVAGLGDAGLGRAGAEFPAVAVAQHGNDDTVGAVGVHLQFGARHRVSSASVFTGLVMTSPRQ